LKIEDGLDDLNEEEKEENNNNSSKEEQEIQEESVECLSHPLTTPNPMIEDSKQHHQKKKLMLSGWRRNPDNEGLPVYILVNGWFEEGRDVRVDWGGCEINCCEILIEEEEEEDKELEEEIQHPIARMNTPNTTNTNDTSTKEEEEKEEEEENHHHHHVTRMRIGSGSSWFKDMIPSGEGYLLMWERERLMEWNIKAKLAIPWEKCAKLAIENIVKQSTYHALFSTFNWPLLLVEKFSFIDDIWVMIREKTKMAGEMLAKILMDRPHGSRPVSLIGYSYGARLIFHCLEYLNEHQDDNPEKSGRGIVENVVLIGCPLARSLSDWDHICHIVCGKVFNVFSSKDCYLALLFRLHNWWEMSVSGIQEVNHPMVTNIDISHLISNHFNYPNHLEHILSLLNLEN